MGQKEVIEQHRMLTALSRRFPERYVAMVGNKVLAVGKDQFKVLKAAEGKIGKKSYVIGIYYLPGRKKHLYLLIHLS